MEDKNIKQNGRDLVSTSVDDLQSSLWFYDGTNPAHVQILEHGLKICERRGEKTKVKLLKTKIRKLQKDVSHASV